MKIAILRSDTEFVEKYGQFINSEIERTYSTIREAVKCVTRIRNYEGEEAMVAVTIFLNNFPDEDMPLGFSLFKLDVEFAEKITFSLSCNDDEPVFVDIDGFPCWNAQDEERMYKIREKYKREHEGPGLLYP